MSDSALKRQIRERLDKLQVEENSIVVLKGIPISVVDPDNASQIDFEKAAGNKLAYFFGITTSNRRFLTYEEFLLMSEFILSQYKTVYIESLDLCDECIEANSAAEEEYCKMHAKDAIPE